MGWKADISLTLKWRGLFLQMLGKQAGTPQWSTSRVTAELARTAGKTTGVRTATDGKSRAMENAGRTIGEGTIGATDRPKRNVEASGL